jgi:exopolyphosphatase
LDSYSITEDSLYFIEDFKRIAASDVPIELTLVDHCNIQGDVFTDYLSKGKLDIVGIIDHHQDESVFLNANPRIIHSNGSCSALVFNYWYDQFSNKDIFYEKDNEIVPLLLGSLLIDTSNMSQKVEEGDVIAFKEYQNILQKNEILLKGLGNYACQSTDNIEKLLKGYYKQIKVAKKDMKGFKFYDILKKDYKQFKFTSRCNVSTVVGFSSIGKSFYWLLSNYSMQEISETFNEIMKDFNLDLLIMTTSYTRQENDQYTREFSYAFNSSNPRKDILLQLANLANDELKLDSDIYKLENLNSYLADLGKGQTFKIYNQNNTAASRKQIVPVIKDILENN